MDRGFGKCNLSLQTFCRALYSGMFSRYLTPLWWILIQMIGHAVPISLPVRQFDHSSIVPLAQVVEGDLLFFEMSAGRVSRRQMVGNQLGPMESLAPLVEERPASPSPFGLVINSGVVDYPLRLLIPPQYGISHSVPWGYLYSTIAYDITPDWIVKQSYYADNTRSLWPPGISESGNYLEVTSKDPEKSFSMRIGTGNVIPGGLAKILIRDNQALLITFSNPRSILALDLLGKGITWTVSGIPNNFNLVGFTGDAAIFTDNLYGDICSQVIVYHRNRPGAPFVMGVPDARSTSFVGTESPAFLRVVTTSAGFWTASSGSFTRDSAGIRHYTLKPDGVPELDFHGKLPLPPRIPNSLESQFPSFAADENRGVFVSNTRGIEVFDRVRDQPVLTIADVELSESEERVQVRASLDRVPTSPVTFTLRPSSASAVVGDDFSDFTTVITIPAGSTQVTWSQSVISDKIKEHDEMFQVRVTDLVGASQERDFYNVKILGSGLTQVSMLVVKGAPASFSGTELLSYSDRGFLMKSSLSGKIASCASDGTYLGMLGGPYYSLEGYKQLSDQSWSAFQVDHVSSRVIYLNWAASGGEPRHQVDLTPLGDSTSGSRIVLVDGRVIFWSSGKNAKVLDPATGILESLPLSPNDLIPAKVIFAETSSKVVVYGNFSVPILSNPGYFNIFQFISTFSKSDLSPLLHIPPGEIATPNNYTSSAIFATEDTLFLNGTKTAIDLDTGFRLWGVRDLFESNYPFMLSDPKPVTVLGLFDHTLVIDGANNQVGLTLMDVRTGFVLSRLSLSSSIWYDASFRSESNFISISQSVVGPVTWRYTGIIPVLPELKASLSTALPGKGCVLTAGWDTPFSRGATVSWKLKVATGSKLASEFPVRSGQFSIPSEGYAKILIPMRSADSLKFLGETFSLELTTPNSADSSAVLTLSNRILNGFETIKPDEEIPAPGGGLPQYDKLAFGSGVVAARVHRFYPETALSRSEVDLFEAVTGRYLRSLVPANQSDNSSFGIAIQIQGDFILVGAPYSTPVNYRPETDGAVSLYRLSTGALVRRFTNTLRVTGFGEAIASDGTYFAIGAPGYMPSGLRGAKAERGGFIVYRWSDLKSVASRINTNEYLGCSLAFREGQLLVGAPFGTVQAGRNRIVGAGVVYSFQPASKRMVVRWKPTSPVGGGMFGRYLSLSENAAWVSGIHQRDPSYGRQGGLWGYSLDGIPGSPTEIADPDRYRPFRCDSVTSHTSALKTLGLEFNDLRNGVYLGSIKLTTGLDITHNDHCFADGQLYWITNGSLFRKAMASINTFGIWSRINLGEAAVGDPSADVNLNQVPDFDEYLDVLLADGPLVEMLSGSSQSTRVFRQTRDLPPGISARLEFEVAPGQWQLVATREGAEPWTSSNVAWIDGVSPDLNLPSSVSSPSARLIITPHPSL